MKRPRTRRKSSTKAWDGVEGAHRSLMEAIQRRDRRYARLTRTARIAATGFCGLLALGGLAAGANALLSATTDIPFVLKPPSDRDAPTAQTTTDDDTLRARLLRVPANSLGPTLPIPIAAASRPGRAISYATRLDLCVVITPPLRRQRRYLPVTDTFWNCYDKRNIARKLRTRWASYVYFTRGARPLVIGFARGDIARVAVRGPDRVMPAAMSLPWKAGVPGGRPVRLWAAYTLSLLDRVGSDDTDIGLSELRVTATTDRGVTRRVPFP